MAGAAFRASCACRRRPACSAGPRGGSGQGAAIVYGRPGPASPPARQAPGRDAMRLRIGYELTYDFPQPTPVILVLNVHYSRASDLEAPDPSASTRRCRSPATATASATGAAASSPPPGASASPPTPSSATAACPTRSPPTPAQHPVEELPDEALVFLLASRYCETDRCSTSPGSSSAHTPPGWPRVQAICDFVHEPHRLRLRARAPDPHGLGGLRRTARRLPRLRAPRRRLLPRAEHPGALLHRLPRRHRHAAAVAARDFAAWFEAYLGGRWHTVRPAQQCAAHRPRPDGPRPRRRRRRAHHHFRPQHADELPGLDRRDPGRRAVGTGGKRLRSGPSHAYAFHMRFIWVSHPEKPFLSGLCRP